MSKFTICVLLYGDHPELAARCLQSIVQLPTEQYSLRIGMNACSPRTYAAISQLALPLTTVVYTSETNRHKYPMMRAMIHGQYPVTTDYLMWFDDDSYLDEDTQWLTKVDAAMQVSDMIGSIYSIGWLGQQREFVKAQSWYNGRDTAARAIRFATGGWWTIRTELLYKFNYPWTDLDHRGGDAMLGELCYQQGLRLNKFNQGIHINADARGRESKAARRGFDQQPYGAGYDPGVAAALQRAATPPAGLTPPKPRIVEL